MMIKLNVALIFFLWLGKVLPGQAQNVPPLRPLPGFKGMVGRIFDGKTGDPKPSRIEVYNETGILQDTYYKNTPGIFTDDGGTFRMPLDPGKYSLRISHGIDYLSQQHAFEISNTNGVEATIYLKPWVPLRAKGWVTGEGHAHLYTEKKPDHEMLNGVRKICRAQGIDFICAAQGWAGADDNTWEKDYAGISDSNFRMYYGAEMPKYRTGHTWWLGLERTRNFFWNTMDTVYENLYYQSFTATHWDFSSVDLPNFSDVEFVPRLARAQHAAAIIAHPTRWWMQDRDKIIKYTNNAVANLAFSLLSGNLWDGLVIMGDRKDNYSYQNLWFNILNEGYRIPALAELDGGYTPEFKFPYGLMRTYFQVDSANKDIITGAVDAVRAGKTFVTTGPIILTQIDNKYAIGDVIPAGGTSRTLHLEAYASGDSDDYLSYVIIFRNGKILESWDLRQEKIRSFKKDVSIIETERAWYVLKAYGKNAWANPGDLDVMSWFDTHTAEEQEEHDVCITSPYYFLPKGQGKPETMMTDVSLTMVSPTDKGPALKGKLEVYHLGRKVNTIPFQKGEVRFSMPVNAMVKIIVQGLPAIHRSLYLDFEPHRKLLENLANGDWREKPAYKGKVFPGYIPWRAFQLEETRQLLHQVKWELTLEPNERDKQWEKFEQVFTWEESKK